MTYQQYIQNPSIIKIKLIWQYAYQFQIQIMRQEEPQHYRAPPPQGRMPERRQPQRRVVDQVDPYEMRVYHEPEHYVDESKSPIEELEDIPQNGMKSSIFTTLVDEIINIIKKFLLATFPIIVDQKSLNFLRNWDLWGPFIIGILYMVLIDSGDEFLTMVKTLFLGGSLVNFNVRTLGGKISYLQSISILGYCYFPMFMTLFVLQVIRIAGVKSFVIRAIAITFAAIWCMFSARAFIAPNVPKQKKLVAVFPIALYYIYMGSNLIFA